jgi:hypothetical protein
MREKLRMLLTVNALVGILFGLILLLVPDLLLRLYGMNTDAAGLLLARILGVEFIGYGILGWILRKADPAPAASPARAIVQAHLISEALGTVVTGWAALSGLGNSLLWSVVAVYGLMAVCFVWAEVALGGERPE